jgi:Outer membrane lipoprotein-sorting protein
MTIVNSLKKRSSLIAVLLLFSITGASYGAEKISSIDFLNRVRHPAGRKTWSMLTGKISHRRRGKPTESVPLYLGILFSRDRTLAQVIVDNTQSYMVGQEYSTKNSATTIIPHNPAGYKKPILADYGIKPEDLTMSFIYWNFIKELPEESLKTLNCRVFELTAPGKKEKVRIYISSAYYFPMKVEWIKAKVEKPYRTLQVSDFTQTDKIWLVTRLKFYGPGWRSVIDFDEIKAGLTQKNIPKELFKKL